MMKEDNVPKWFNDFAVQNQKEHGELKAAIESGDGELGRRIEKVKGDLTWRMVIMAGVTIGAIGLMKTLSGG